MCFSTNITKHPQAIKFPSATMAITKPCRPYTEYNLFFQLEREYILQVELGFQPDYELSEVFDPSDSSNYQGPPLPSRYSGLILLSDWHLPGKEKRRKRRHRKTHGKIGFHELSLRIADSWKNVDAETRTFCAELCDVGLMQYKIAMRAYKAAHPEEDAETCKTAELQGKKASSAALDDLAYLFDAAPSNSRYIPTDRCTMAEVDAAFENDLSLSLEDFNESLSDLSASSGSDSSLRCSLAGSMVDIEDDEIIKMWKSEPEVVGSAYNTGAFATTSTSATVVTDSSISYASRVASAHGTLCQFIHREPPQQQHQETVSSSFDPYGQNSHIDATLNDLKNMRKILLSQQIQMQSSIMAARLLTEEQKKRHGRTSTGRRSFAACSA
ncbi:hypothetical protein ACHAWX_001515 [Stephanocyclus meneghinianus]